MPAPPTVARVRARSRQTGVWTVDGDLNIALDGSYSTVYFSINYCLYGNAHCIRGVLDIMLTTDNFQAILRGEDRFKVFAEARRESPVVKVQENWHLFRYADVSYALKNPGDFSSNPVHAPQWWKDLRPQTQGGENMVLTDGELHRRLRQPFQRFLTDGIHRLFPELLTRITRDVLTSADLTAGLNVGEVLGQIPMKLAEELLDVKLDLEQVHYWGRYGPQNMSMSLENSDEHLDSLERSTANEAIRARLEMKECVQEIMSKHANGVSRKGVVGDLLELRREGQLTQQEVESISLSLLFSAGQTIHEGIFNCIYAMVAHPATQDALVNDPSVIPSFIHETLRLYTPSQFATRITTKSVTMGGVTIPKGAIVNLWLASANRDEDIFEDANCFKLGRYAPDRHLAFGDGPRYCSGATLTGLLIGTIIEQLLSLFGRIRAKDEPIQWLASLMAFRPERLIVERANVNGGQKILPCSL